MKRIYWKGLVSVFGVLLFWELLCRLGLVQSTLLPPPTVVFDTLVQLILSGEILKDAGTSLQRVFVGFCIAAVAGIVCGVLTGVSRRFKEYATPLLEILRPIPPVAFIPIAVLWFGIGDKPAYFLVSLGAFFPIFTNTLAGILSVNPLHRDAALCLGANRRMMLLNVMLPASMPYLIAGLKTGLGTAWFCVIVAELVGAQSGLGYMIQLNRLTLQSEKVLAGMIAIGALGFAMNRAMVFVQRRAVRWQVKSLEA
jgi:NitT/TauT family transport system permease protein/sulfonate transport system permease protein